MIGVWIDEGGGLRVRDDLPLPEPGSGEAVVRVLLAGICGTDLQLRWGYRGFSGIPGHEFVGVVEEGPTDWGGARVVSEINITCRSDPSRPPCRPCASERPSHCAHREVIGIRGRDGAFAERVRVPVANLHRVPAEVPNDVAVFTEPLAAAFRVLEQVEIGSVSRALVLGAGRLGQLVARVLSGRLSGLEVAGRSEHSLTRARAAGLTARDAASLPSASYDLVIDCTGTEDGFAAARHAVRPRGMILLKSTYHNDVPIDISSFVVDEIRLVGSRCGPFRPALSALERGEIEVSDLIDDHLPLSAAERGFAKAAEPGIAKVLLVP